MKTREKTCSLISVTDKWCPGTGDMRHLTEEWRRWKQLFRFNVMILCTKINYSFPYAGQKCRGEKFVQKISVTLKFVVRKEKRMRVFLTEGNK